MTITDLPGVYSLSPYSPEEIVTRDYLMSGAPDVVVNLVDATNLERNLYLTTQIINLGLPVVVALNMMDLVEKNGDRIDVAKLSEMLGCPVVTTSALKGRGMQEVVDEALAAAKHGAPASSPLRFGDDASSPSQRSSTFRRPRGLRSRALVCGEAARGRAAHHRRARPSRRRSCEGRRHPRGC